MVSILLFLEDPEVVPRAWAETGQAPYQGALGVLVAWAFLAFQEYQGAYREPPSLGVQVQVQGVHLQTVDGVGQLVIEDFELLIISQQPIHAVLLWNLF